MLSDLLSSFASSQNLLELYIEFWLIYLFLHIMLCVTHYFMLAIANVCIVL